MPNIKPKQLDKYITGRVHVQGVNVPTGNTSVDITTQLTTALTTASDQGTSVPLQPYVLNTAQGLILSAPKNLVEIYVGKQKLMDNGVNEVYGRIVSNTAGVYEVEFYYYNGAMEIAYETQAFTNMELVIPYVFDFVSLPTDFATSLKTAFVNDDPVANVRIRRHVLIVTALNTLSPLANDYVGGHFKMTINGVVYDEMQNSPAAWTIDLATRAVNWNPFHAGFNLLPSDQITVEYAY